MNPNFAGLAIYATNGWFPEAFRSGQERNSCSQLVVCWQKSTQGRYNVAISSAQFCAILITHHAQPTDDVNDRRGGELEKEQHWNTIVTLSRPWIVSCLLLEHAQLDCQCPVMQGRAVFFMFLLCAWRCYHKYQSQESLVPCTFPHFCIESLYFLCTRQLQPDWMYMRLYCSEPAPLSFLEG